jgi:hypothetical protein
VDALARLDALVFRCPVCGAWRLPPEYMRRPHCCFRNRGLVL